MHLRRRCSALSLFAEVLSNDKPLVVRYEGQLVFPDACRRLSGDDLRRRLPDAGRLPRSVHPRAARASRATGRSIRPIRYAPQHAQLLREVAEPGAADRARTGSAPTTAGRDLLARLLYGFRVSRAVRAVVADRDRHGARHRSPARCRATSPAGPTSAWQRFIEIWGSMPELYLLIIFVVDLRAQLLRCC